MNAPVLLTSDLLYPESDGQPMADNSKQFRWIFVLFGNLAALFRDRDDVLVGGNQYWYPRVGQAEVRLAPDVFVVCGRPKGDRRSYKQWEEDNVPLTVVFEILSPGNTFGEMADKHAFYEEHGVEEYYVYDPESNHLAVYVRQGEVLRRVRPAQGFVSPRLGIRFDTNGPELLVFHPNGERFLTFEEISTAREEAQQETRLADKKARQAQQQVERAQQQVERAQQRASRLAALSRKARRGQATPEEFQELERLEDDSAADST